jgi:hypothetical protein
MRWRRGRLGLALPHRQPLQQLQHWHDDRPAMRPRDDACRVFWACEVSRGDCGDMTVKAQVDVEDDAEGLDVRLNW